MIVTSTSNSQTIGNNPSNHDLGADISYPYLVDRLFDLSADGRNEALTPDLQALVLSVKNSDFGSQAQAIIIDLIRMLAKIRKQNNELWEKQADLAYNSAGFTANAQKAASLATARAELINNAATAIGTLFEIGASAYGLGKSNTEVAKIKAEADGMDWSRPRANTDTDAGEGVDNGFVRPKGAPPAYEEQPPVYSEKPLPTKLDTDEGGIVETIPSKSGKGDADGANGNNPDADIDLQAKNEYINDKTRNVYSKLEMQTRIVNALGQFITAVIKEGGASQTIEAGQRQAEATIDQAVSQYLHGQAQASLDYANEIRDYSRSIIEMIKSIEQARHQAHNAIIQIV